MVHLAYIRFFMCTSIDSYRANDLLQKETNVNEIGNTNTRNGKSSANASIEDRGVPQVDRDSKEPFLANLEGMSTRSGRDDGGQNVQDQRALVSYLLLDYWLNC